MPLPTIGQCAPNICYAGFPKTSALGAITEPPAAQTRSTVPLTVDPARPRWRELQILTARERVMFDQPNASSFIARLRARRHPAAARRAKQNGRHHVDHHRQPDISAARSRRSGRAARGAHRILATIILSFVPLVGFTTTAALACACGCSVFDVGGLDLPQEQDHGGRVFFEFWGGDQTQNYVGSSRAPAALNLDKQLNTQWYNVGFSYNFNRDWGVMVRIPTANRTLTTDTGAFAGITSFNSKDIGDIEIMGMYTGFFKDMSTGIMFGVKLPTGTFTAPGLDRDNQIGTGSTDLVLGAFHRGLLTRRQCLAVFCPDHVATAVPLPGGR